MLRRYSSERIFRRISSMCSALGRLADAAGRTVWGREV